MKKVHMIGIGGTGLSAIARVLLEMGYAVTGSDRVETPFIHELRTAGATIAIGHSPENVGAVDAVIRSSAIPDTNPEVSAARERGIPVLKRADFLGELMAGKTGVAVAGTHGKTTTTAMLAWVLTALEQEPTFIAGGVLNELHTNAHAGKGNLFVIEADEYDHMFLGLKPSIEVITNVEHDHPDCFPTPQDFQDAFVDFVRLLPPDGTLVACADDPGARSMLLEAQAFERNVIAYGIQTQAEAGQPGLQTFTTSLNANEHGGFTFTATVLGKPTTTVLQVPGRHNVQNALAVLSVIGLLGLDLGEASAALSQFTGTGRRFEVRGKAGGVFVIDDYAHHPTEIKATLSAARTRYPNQRIWTVWQPHTFSRTQTLFEEFTLAFGDADFVIVTEIYAARETNPGFSARNVVEAMSHPAVKFIPRFSEVCNYLVSNLRPGDVLLVLSAGDGDTISTSVLTCLRESEEKNGRNKARI